MKTKTYELTETEILTLREALDFYYYGHVVKIQHAEIISPLAKQQIKNVKPLIEQFKNDYRLLK